MGPKDLTLGDIELIALVLSSFWEIPGPAALTVGNIFARLPWAYLRDELAAEAAMAELAHIASLPAEKWRQARRMRTAQRIRRAWRSSDHLSEIRRLLRGPVGPWRRACRHICSVLWSSPPEADELLRKILARLGRGADE